MAWRAGAFGPNEEAKAVSDALGNGPEAHQPGAGSSQFERQGDAVQALANGGQGAGVVDTKIGSRHVSAVDKQPPRFRTLHRAHVATTGALREFEASQGDDGLARDGQALA